MVKLAMILALLFPCLAAAQVPAADGYLSGDGKMIFTGDKDRIPTAIDAVTGEVRWQAKKNGIVAGLWKNYVLVLEQDRVVFLAAKNGKRVRISEKLGLPLWASVFQRFHSHGGQSFIYKALVLDNRLYINWSGRVYTVSGAAGLAESQKGGGILDITLATGRVSKTEKMPSPSMPAISKELEKDPPFMFILGKNWRREPLAVDGRLLNLRKEKERYILEYMDPLSGETMDSVELGKLRPGEEVVPWVSSDRLHMLVHTYMPGESPDMSNMTDAKQSWTVFSLKDGLRISAVDLPLLMADVTVCNGIIYLLIDHEHAGRFHNRRLRALDYGGNKLWEFELWAPPVFPPVP